LKFFRVISNLLRFDRTNWTALTLCLCAAAVFWIFNALNKNYSSNLSFPLLLDYDQVKYATAERIPARLTVNVHGNGWELLRKTLGQKVPVISIPLERPTEVRRIAGAALAPQVMSQLGNLQLNYVVLDTLRLSIEPRVTRKFKLTGDISRLTFRNNVGRIGPVIVLPDSIQLNGPASYLRSLPDSIVILAPNRRVNASYRENLEVQLEHSEFVQRDPPVAELMFEVGPLVELSQKYPLSLPRASGMVAETDSLLVRFRIPQRDAEQFAGVSGTIAASLPEINLSRGDTVRLLPRLEGVPPYAEVVQLDSVAVRKRLPE